MSMANRATTRAESVFLESKGWYHSNLESMNDPDADGLYVGNWFHREVKDGHKGPDEALAITRRWMDEPSEF